MEHKSRDQIIVLEIAKKALQPDKVSAWKYLRSVSAMCEASIVTIANTAQNKIQTTISRFKAEQLQRYETGKSLDSIKAILGKMVGDIELVTSRMVAANILAGKVQNTFGKRTKPDELIPMITLSENDWARIEKTVSGSMERVKHGAELTMASMSGLIQKACIRANMPHPEINASKEEPKDKEQKKEEKKLETPKQEPISSEFSGEKIGEEKTSPVYRETMPTKDELEHISKDPSAYVTKFARANRKEIQAQRDRFFAERMLRTTIHSEPPIDPDDKDRFAKAELRNLVKEIKENGVYAFTDKGGKRWNLINYCSMTARTTSTEADNTGAIVSDKEQDLYYIVPHSGSCPLCKKYEGKVYSRSGKNKKYPPLSSVFQKIDPNGPEDLDNTYMAIHPNCRHLVVAYHEQKKNPVSSAIVKKNIKK